MRHVEHAIKDAIDKGEWPDHHVSFVAETGEMINPGVGIFLDPSFWQALGKARGWEADESYRPHRIGAHSDDYGGASDADCFCDKPKIWIDHWHRFIDHLAEGKDAESFFASI